MNPAGEVVAVRTDPSRARVHLEFLERHGYVLSVAECQELDRATADQDAEPGE
jgi:hypothetical protein